VRRVYNENLKAVNANQKRIIVTIPRGSSVKDIATLLHQRGLIRSTWAFVQYAKSKDVQDQFKAGTYSLQPSQDVPSIVDALTQGKILTNLVTIPPGSRIDQVRQILIDNGFAAAGVDAALNPNLYRNHPALSDMPSDATSLEGYLYPESFEKTADTKPQEIIRESLDEMQKRLTPEMREAIQKQGLTVGQGIILASIVEQEVSKPADKPQVAQVFLKRLRQDMMLESDVTAFYGAILAHQTNSSVTFDSAYNTHFHNGLPPGPISNVSKSSLDAVANPASTDWLFFVSGDDGVTYFSKTVEEHEALVAQHCKTLCN
jgi:UPF0755 protein